MGWWFAWKLRICYWFGVGEGEGEEYEEKEKASPVGRHLFAFALNVC